jgi:hypothetical protein
MIIDCPSCQVVQTTTPAPAPAACPLVVGTHQIGVMLPCSKSSVSAQPALIEIGISDKDAAVPAAVIPIQVQAPDMANVEVWTHGKMASRLTNAGNGEFVGTLDLSKEPAGPVRVRFMAWDAPPGGNATLYIVGEYALIVAGTRPAIPTPTPAAGMTLAFSDHFTTLSSTPCKPGTGTWPNCTAPTASDGFKWFENMWNGGDFGDCANEHTDGKYNPFTILPSGGLRIRNTFDKSYNDPYGYGRHQYCGVLSTGYKDGSNTLTTTDGYYDARVLVPNSSCPSCSGGTWPSFWMLSTNGPGWGTVELDMMEMYGSDSSYFQGYTHAYPPATIPGAGNGYAGHPDGDLTWDWHTVGMLITGSGTAAGKVCNYFDEVQLACSAMPQLGPPSAAVKPNWTLMVELAAGGGWPTAAPPANQYDFFVDWVGVWH